MSNSKRDPSADPCRIHLMNGLIWLFSTCFMASGFAFLVPSFSSLCALAPLRETSSDSRLCAVVRMSCRRRLSGIV